MANFVCAKAILIVSSIHAVWQTDYSLGIRKLKIRDSRSNQSRVCRQDYAMMEYLISSILGAYLSANNC